MPMGQWMGPDRTPEEIAFQRWYAHRANRAGIGLDPDDPRHQYDYRGAYEAGAEPEIQSDQLYHWPSEFKRDLHPNRFIDGIDTRTGQPRSSLEELPSLADLSPLMAQAEELTPYSRMPIRMPVRSLTDAQPIHEQLEDYYLDRQKRGSDFAPLERVPLHELGWGGRPMSADELYQLEQGDIQESQSQIALQREQDMLLNEIRQYARG
jgi:hypothetical protein